MLRLTRAQVREIDRRAIEEYHIPGIVLMENAAIHVANVATAMLRKRFDSVLIIVGAGNNAGDGLAVARHLKIRGFLPRIAYAAPYDHFKGDAKINSSIVQAMGLPCVNPVYQSLFSDRPLVIDALFGTGLVSAPRDWAIKPIELMNSSECPIVSIDVPSGLDCDTGKPLGVCVKATKTVTFVAEKAGFANPESKQFTGEVIVGDIGCPRELIEDVARTAH